MQSSLQEPNEVTFLNVLPAIAYLGALDIGKWIYAYIDKNMKEEGSSSDSSLYTSLIDMYSKCGSAELAEKVFSALKIKSLSSWNTMIAGLAMHGLADKALACYERMKKEVFELDEITFVKVVSVGILPCFQVRDDDSRGSNRICKYCHIATFHNVDPVKNNWYQSMSILPNTVGLQSCWFGRNW
nr:pentatricopeptide repeat protein AaPPR1195 [Agave angustifolia]